MQLTYTQDTPVSHFMQHPSGGMIHQEPFYLREGNRLNPVMVLESQQLTSTGGYSNSNFIPKRDSSISHRSYGNGG